MVEHSKTGIEEIIRESAIDKEKKTPGLKFNHGLVPIGFRTTGAWLESGIQLSESGIPLTIRIPNPESRILVPPATSAVLGSDGIHNPRPSWIPLRGQNLKTRLNDPQYSPNWLND